CHTESRIFTVFWSPHSLRLESWLCRSIGFQPAAFLLLRGLLRPTPTCSQRDTAPPYNCVTMSPSPVPTTSGRVCCALLPSFHYSLFPPRFATSLHPIPSSLSAPISALTGSSGVPSLPTLPPHLAARCQNTAQSPVPHDNQWDHDSFTLPRDPYDGIREDHGAFERAALCLLCFVCLRTLRSYHLFLRALSTSTRMKAGIGPRSVQRVSLLIMSVMSSGV
ncbi:hypothetical protein B0H14DRAFT_3786531, partial [Mycena olivaceomarginata]